MKLKYCIAVGGRERLDGTICDDDDDEVLGLTRDDLELVLTSDDLA